MCLTEKLVRIQANIKAPKNLYNSFGRFHYRSAEGIYEAVKPYLQAEGCLLLLSDEVVEVGGRIYIKATAKLQDSESMESVCVEAFAREAEQKSGMDASQLTGTASSYARKYALNGLFLLDDAKDADTDEYTGQTKEDGRQQGRKEKEKITKDKAEALRARCEKEGISQEVIRELYRVHTLEELTNRQYQNILDNWEKILQKGR